MFFESIGSRRVTLRLLRDLVRYAPGQFAPILIATLSVAIFTRIASPAAYGSFVLVSALSMTLSQPFAQWLMQGMLRFYPAAARDGRAPQLEYSLSVLSLGFAALTTLIVIVATLLGLAGTDLNAWDVAAAGVMTFFGVAAGAPLAAMMARFESARYSVINVVTSILKLLLPLALLPVLGPVAALLWGSAVGTLLVWSVLTWGQLRGGRLAYVSLHDLRSTAREALSFGMPLGVSQIGIQALQYSDRFFISFLLGAAAVGLYSTNYSIAEKLLILVQAPLIYAAHPQIVSSWEQHLQAHTERMVKNATRWLLILGTPLVAFCVVRSEMVSAVLLGDAFVPGHAVIPIVALGVLIYAASQYGHKSFELSKDTWVIAITLSAAAVVNTLAVIGLTLAFGYIGGAFATLLGYLSYAGVTYVISRRRGPFRWQIPWRSTGLTVVAGSVASLVWALMPTRLTSVLTAVEIGVVGLLGLAVYAAFLMAVGELPRNLRPSSALALLRPQPVTEGS
jgi:O-antigen/teichoic acid export membrane protein